MFPTYPSYNQLRKKSTPSLLKSRKPHFYPIELVLSIGSLPGHPSSLQFLCLVDSPVQVCPPYWACWASILIDVWDPPPQVTEQLVQASQAPQLQSTEVERGSEITVSCFKLACLCRSQSAPYLGSETEGEGKGLALVEVDIQELAVTKQFMWSIDRQIILRWAHQCGTHFQRQKPALLNVKSKSQRYLQSPH